MKSSHLVFLGAAATKPKSFGAQETMEWRARVVGQREPVIWLSLKYQNGASGTMDENDIREMHHAHF